MTAPRRILTPSTLTKKPPLEWADILGPVRDFEAAVSKTRGRSLTDLPSVKPGAKEIALLTLFKEEQRFALEPVMRALQSLAQLDDWSGHYFVADRVESKFFDWRQTPLRKYESFEDFYQQELESVWGKWSVLQAEWAEVIKGKKSAKDVEGEIAKRAQALNAKAPDYSRPIVRKSLVTKIKVPRFLRLN